MNSLFERIIPNVLNNSEELLSAIKDTLIMVSVSGIISIFLGLIIGYFSSYKRRWHFGK